MTNGKNTYTKISNFDYSNTPVSTARPKFFYKPLLEGQAPLISIVTPFYNTDQVFFETVQSVLQQSLQQFEWIIVNDGSDEPQSIEILNWVRHLDPRIKVIDHPSNLGLPSARNTGVREASTSYVLFLDSDDLLEPTAAEKWYWFLETNPQYSFVKGYTVGFGAINYLWARGFHQKELFLQENVVDVTSLVRKEVVVRVGGFDESLRNGFEDWDFWLKCANAGYWGATIPEYLIWYRRKENPEQRWRSFKDPRTIARILRSRYRNLSKRYFSSLPLCSFESTSQRVEYENLLNKSSHRLLMIIPWLNWGGADKFNLDLARLLVENGWEITIATTLISEDPWWQEFINITPDIFMLHRFLPIRAYPDFLVYLIKTRKPDVVLISNSEIGYLLLPYLRSCCPDPLYLDFCHMEEEEWMEGGYPRLSLRHQDFLDLTVVASEHLRKWMIDRGGRAERIQTCYINVDTNLWQPDIDIRDKVRKRLSIGENIPLIVYAARFCDQKQPLVFARVMKRLADQGLSFLALAVGDGPEKKDLIQFIKKHGLEKFVRLIGSVDSRQMREILQAADIFFLPSKWEGIALSIYEAMSCGLAVVGAKVGGQAELVDDASGILIEPSGDIQQDIENYTRILSQLISDKSLRERLGVVARQRVLENFDLKYMIKKMFDLFEYAKFLHISSSSRFNISDAEAKQIAYEVINDYSKRTYTSVEWLNNYWKPYSLRIRAYYWIRANLYPVYYHLVKQRGLKWIIGLKNLLVRYLTYDSSEEP